MIEIRNVSKIYETRQGAFTALNNVSLAIEDGDVFGIIGLSGAGKSTLVRCINLLEKPSSGSIIIGGEDLTTADKAKLRTMRRKVSMIFQQFNLLQQRTVLKNVELAGEIDNNPRRREKAIELLTTVGLKDKLDSYPSELSGGQQQRVAIARALMTDPEVLLCDEATSALDPEMVREVLDVILGLAQEGKTMLIVTHEMQFARAVADRVLFFDGGEIVEQDIPERFFEHPKTERAQKFLHTFEFDAVRQHEA